MARTYSRSLVLLLLAGVWLVNMQTIQAGGKVDPVKISAKGGKPDSAGKQKVTVTLTIEDGWYVYANPVDNEQFAPNALQVKVKGGTAKVVYPPAKEKTETLNGEIIKFKVYRNKAQVVAEVQRTANALEVAVRFNACNDKGQCLAPITKKVPVE